MGRERKCKQIIDGLKEMRRYWILKEEALGCSLWRTCYKRGYIRMMHTLDIPWIKSLDRVNKEGTTCWSIQEFSPHMFGCFWQIDSHRKLSAWRYCS